jgi:hypothetical protein
LGADLKPDKGADSQEGFTRVSKRWTDYRK